MATKECSAHCKTCNCLDIIKLTRMHIHTLIYYNKHIIIIIIVLSVRCCYTATKKTIRRTVIFYWQWVMRVFTNNIVWLRWMWISKMRCYSYADTHTLTHKVWALPPSKWNENNNEELKWILLWNERLVLPAEKERKTEKRRGCKTIERSNFVIMLYFFFFLFQIWCRNSQFFVYCLSFDRCISLA